MNIPKLKPYKKEFGHSYTFGVFPTLELIKRKPNQLVKVYLDNKSVSNFGVKEILNECEKRNIQYEYNSGLVSKLAVKENTFALSVFKKYNSRVEPTKNTVVIVNPSDPGNLGTIIRTMVGFEVINLAIIKPGVDVFDPKVIRASMGAVFMCNFEYFDSFEEFKSKSKIPLFMFALGASKEFSNVKLPKPYGLVFGSEAAGLSSEVLKYGTPVKINHSNNIDSLNLSVACGIALYGASREI